MKAISRILELFCTLVIGQAQFYSPETEYHDPVQRVFPVEAARVLAAFRGLAKQDVSEITYAVSTRPDGTTSWEIHGTDDKRQPVVSVKVAYPKALLESGPNFYREVFARLWKSGLCDQPLQMPNSKEIPLAFWRGSATAALGREEGLAAALDFMAPAKTAKEAMAKAPELAGRLIQAALPSIADRLTLDNLLVARAATLLAMSEHGSAQKFDLLWAPVLFLGNRDRAAAALWQHDFAADAKGAPLPQQMWNLILRNAGTRASYLFAAENPNLAFTLPVLTYDLRVNESQRLLADLLPDLARTNSALARAHNYAPLISSGTTVGGGHILQGFWPIYSRAAGLQLLAMVSRSNNEVPALEDEIARATNRLASVDRTVLDDTTRDPSLFAFTELAPIYRLGHTEGGKGPLRPCLILSVRDALNYAWEMAGLQLSGRYYFVRWRWGINELASGIFKTATGQVQGRVPFFRNERDSGIAKYADSLARLEMLEGLWRRIGTPGIAIGRTLPVEQAAPLWVKRWWLRPLDFDWQVRYLWDAKLPEDIANFMTTLHENSGSRATIEILRYLSKLKKSDRQFIPDVENLQSRLADSIAQPTRMTALFLERRDFEKLDLVQKGEAYEKLFWRNPDGDLEDMVFYGYLGAQANAAAKRFYLEIRPNITDPVAFSGRLGRLLWILGYVTNDASLRKQVLEDSQSGSYADMMLNIWDYALNGQNKKLAEQVDDMIERYESEKGPNSLARSLKNFLPLVPALKDPKHPRRTEALTYFGTEPNWTMLRWIWIEKFKIPTEDAITLLGGSENDALRRFLISILQKDATAAEQRLTDFYHSRSSADEYTVLSGNLYARMHPPSPAQVPDLMPPGFTFTREAVRKKLGK